jgi:tetratricopeptide (TPR) repeat protein
VSAAERLRSMTEPDARYANARCLLRDLDDAAALRKNPLLASYADESHDRLRARITRAVESLVSGRPATTAQDRRYRLYQVLVRCDLHGESHKAVAAELGISRSQFYVDRREAFLRVAKALDGALPRQQIEAPFSDPLTLHHEFVEMLFKQGRFDAAWRESLRVLDDVRGQPREIDVWTTVADAARILGNIRQSVEALNQLSRIAATSANHEMRREATLRVAISEIALHGVQGKFNVALERFDQAVQDLDNGRTMSGRDLTKFAILLGFGAEICIGCGRWQRANELLQRAEGIIDRSLVPSGSAYLQRQRARIAQERYGDSARCALELHDALLALQHHRHLPDLAMGVVEYGIALADIDRPKAMEYIDYGLLMAKEVCGYDRFAVLVANAAPFILERSGPEETLRELAEVRLRAPLSARADFLIDVAEADARLARGEFGIASEAGISVAQSLENAALFPAAAKARLIAVEAYARDGKTAQARQLFRKSKEFLHTYADYTTRQRARRSGLFLDSFAQ